MNQTAILFSSFWLLCFTASPLSGQGPFQFLAPDEMLTYDVDTGVGSVTLLLCVAENPANPGYPTLTSGLSMFLAHEPMLAVTAVEPAPIIAGVNGGQGPDYFGADLDPDGGTGFTLGIIYNFLDDPVQWLAFPDATEVVEASYETIPSVFMGDPDGAIVPLIWDDNLSPGIPNTVLVGPISGMGSLGVDLLNGVIVAAPPLSPPEFVRGDADGNGVMSGLVDGIFLLAFQFIPGSPAPPCFDAADVDDSGVLNGLVDALHLLNFQFIPGSPPPAPPNSCGVDPTDDGLNCLSATCP